MDPSTSIVGFLSIFLLLILVQANDVPPNFRIDCLPDPPISGERCKSRGCRWTGGQGSWPVGSLPPLNVPDCYFDDEYLGYQVIENVSNGDHVRMTLKRVRPSGFPDDIEELSVDVHGLTPKMVRIRITDKWRPRYEVPIPQLNLKEESGNRYYVVDNEKGEHLVIRRRETDEILFETDLAKLVYADQYIQMAIRLPTDHIYGLGEHYSPFRKSTEWKRYTMFNRDNFPESETALYGSHPFYLAVEKTRHVHGLFLFNSNAMDVLTQPAPIITFRPIGGILDFFLFLGPTAEEVIQQYHHLIGHPTVPPFWSLGFQLSRYGYNNFSRLNETFTRTRNSLIPFDVQWTDIDMMDRNNDFTYDRNRFDELPDFIRETLHRNQMKFIPMFDPGVSAGEPHGTYTPYERGLEMNVFVKHGLDRKPLIGKVWNPLSTVWPDFWHPNATAYWTEMMKNYHNYISFDGVWIDMNEPSNFVDGDMLLGCPADSTLENPPYVPGQSARWPKLRTRTLCMTASHHAGFHYDLHNLFGFQEAIITNAALRKILENKRPFIISRSTAPGHGHYAHHWTGDIVSNWPSMKWSIGANINFNMFGIPMVGADICGFVGNATEELCARWHQLGAFYMFARNHNNADAIDQDPVAFGPVVIEATRKAMILRYAHMAYFYSQLLSVYRNGGTVTRPLFFEFPNDYEAYEIEEKQFMIGPNLMVAPVLEPGINKTNVYFPSGRWLKMPELEIIDSDGEYIEQNASLSDYPNIYYRGGSIMVVQEAQLNAELQQLQDFILVVTLDRDYFNASGSLYWDNGEDFDFEKGNFNRYYFESKNNQSFTIETTHYDYYQLPQKFKKVFVLGLFRSPTSMTLDDQNLENFKFYEDNNILEIGTNDKPLDLPISQRKYNGHNYKFNWKF